MSVTSLEPQLDSSGSKQREWFSSKTRRTLVSYSFLLPAILYFSIFFFYPIALEFWASLRSGLPLVGESQFVGIENYQRILQDKRVIHSFQVTLIYSVGSTVVTAIVGLILALILNQKIRGRVIIRSIIFFPYMISIVIIALLWSNILDPYLGILNSFLFSIGIGGQNWLTNPNSALPAVISLVVWQNMGYAMVIYLAGLQNIPEQYYEAARIDGASKFHLFRYITLPLLAPTTLFITVIGMIGNLQAIAPAYLITRGGPADATNLYAYHVFNVAFDELRIGYASALAFMMFAVIFVLTMIQFKIAGNQVEY